MKRFLVATVTLLALTGCGGGSIHVQLPSSSSAPSGNDRAEMARWWSDAGQTDLTAIENDDQAIYRDSQRGPDLAAMSSDCTTMSEDAQTLVSDTEGYRSRVIAEMHTAAELFVQAGQECEQGAANYDAAALRTATRLTQEANQHINNATAQLQAMNGS